MKFYELIKNSIFKCFKTNNLENQNIYKIRFIDDKLCLCNFNNKDKEIIINYSFFKDNNLKIETKDFYYVVEVFQSQRTYKKVINRKYLDKADTKTWTKRIQQNNEKHINFNKKKLNKISEYNNALYII